jgi:HEAT repeat protein
MDFQSKYGYRTFIVLTLTLAFIFQSSSPFFAQTDPYGYYEKYKKIGVYGDSQWRSAQEAYQFQDTSASQTTQKTAQDHSTEKQVSSQQQTVDSLIKALGDDSTFVRQAAARALGKISTLRAVEALIKALGDENWHICKGAAAVLGRIKRRIMLNLVTRFFNEHLIYGA